MELFALRYFIEVAHQENITHAAEKLHISQPSLSRQISSLESELGKKLFVRKQFRVELTEPGKALLKHAEEIVRLSDLAFTEISSTKTELSGHLSIAFADGTFEGSIPNLVDSFIRSFPSIELDFYSGGLDYIETLKRRHAPDIVCYYTGSSPKDELFVKTDHTLNTGFVMRKDDKLARYNEISRALYKDIQIIYPRERGLDENEKTISLDVNKDQIIAMVEEPLAFLDLVKKGQGYIFCLEPSFEILKGYDLCFRPAVPKKKATVHFVQDPRMVSTDAAKAFMNHAHDFYEHKIPL